VPEYIRTLDSTAVRREVVRDVVMESSVS
jgi:hypothetical protein